MQIASAITTRPRHASWMPARRNGRAGTDTEGCPHTGVRPPHRDRPPRRTKLACGSVPARERASVVRLNQPTTQPRRFVARTVVDNPNIPKDWIPVSIDGLTRASEPAGFLLRHVVFPIRRQGHQEERFFLRTVPQAQSQVRWRKAPLSPMRRPQR